uniref:Uncharacterized protein n=1 Tax=Arundo donax TaxID=35708 RepID=A0A0A9U4X3_ARUDO
MPPSPPSAVAPPSTESPPRTSAGCPQSRCHHLPQPFLLPPPADVADLGKR